MTDDRTTQTLPAAGPVARYRSALAELSGAQKTPRGVSLYTLRVNRPVGRRFAAAAAVLGATPNTVTLVSGAFSFTAIALIAVLPPSVPLGVGVAVLLVLAFMLDSADGQVARLTGASSASGEWTDHVLDCAVKVALHSAVLIALYRDGHDGAVLLLPLAFQLVSVLFFFGGILVGKLREQSAAATPAGPPPGSGLLRQLAMLPIDHGVLCVSFVLWGWTTLFLGVYAALLLATALCLVVFTRKWLQEMR